MTQRAPWLIAAGLSTAATLAIGQPDAGAPLPATPGSAPPPSSPGPPPPVPPAELEKQQTPPGPAAPAAGPASPAGTIATAASPPVLATEAAPPPPAAAPETPAPAAIAEPPPPPPPPRSVVAVIQVLDKVTAETLKFEAPIGKPLRYKTLIFTTRVCETRGVGEPQPRPSAWLAIDSQPAPIAGRAPAAPRPVYRGWMFANAPAIHPVEHAIYDAWLVACSLQSSPTA